MKKHFAYILTLLFCVTSCDDNTGSLGSSIIPDQDNITVDTVNFWASSRSIAVDSVLGKTSKVYLGRFTDPQTKAVFEADFITQFNCQEGGNVFPDNITEESVEKVDLNLLFTDYFGDPNNPMTAEVYALASTLQEGERYYTNLDPTQFYNPDSLLGTESYTATNFHPLENEKFCVKIPLPTKIGVEFVRKYKEDKDFFANATNFIENVCSGFYVKIAGGDGTVLYIDQTKLNIYFWETGSDSIRWIECTGSEEVLHANRFYTKKETLDPLIEEDTWTYLKTPAGIFTEVTLPIDSIVTKVDSINAAKITFTCYNNEESEYQFGIPQTLLMVHKDEMHTFFEKNKLTNNISSFYTTYNNTYNRYEYSNIAQLITYCHNKREAWLAENPGKAIEEYENWNKVVLIPVTTITDSNNFVVNFRHDFNLNSVRLVGGKDKIKIRIVTSKFN